MGLIKSIFGAIFGLIGGIFKTVGGLVGLGKKSEFFMELAESDSDSQTAAPAKVEPAQAKAEPAPAKAEPAKALAKAPAQTKAPVNAAPTPAPVAAAPAGPVPTGFASNYLTSVGTTMPRRRRPGPSLSPFMDMAKQVNGR
jgi:predicted lipid-binding transport protein (Tim44 family)